MKSNIYLIITLDTECDKGRNWRVRSPLSFENVVQGIPNRLQPLFNRYGIRPTYLLSPEVLKDRECVSLFKEMQPDVEIGAHLHPEYIEPFPDYQTEKTLSFLGELDRQIEHAKLKNLTKLIEANFGFSPTSFRAGRFGLSANTLSILESLGYKVDSSVTPFLWWYRRKGFGINYLGSPIQPYYPSAQDFRKPGELGILEVPITISNSVYEKIPTSILLSVRPFWKLSHLLLKPFLKKREQSKWLRPTYSNGNEMINLVNKLYNSDNHTDLVLCMMFHTNEATKGMSPYNQTDSDVSIFLNELEKFFTRLFSNYRIHPIGLSDISKYYEKN